MKVLRPVGAIAIANHLHLMCESVIMLRNNGKGWLVIVCVCNALRENQVKEAARATQSDCPVTAFAKLGCKPKCGQCLPFAREVLARESSYS